MKFKIKLYSLLVMIGLLFIFDIPYQSTLFLPSTIYFIVEQIVILVFFFLSLKLFSNKNKKIVFLFFIGILFMFYSSFLAYLNFHQPIYLGLISERSRLLIIFPLFIFLAIYRKKVSLIEIFDIIKTIGWIAIISYTIFYLMVVLGVKFINTKSFIDISQNKGLIAKFNGTIIVFMIIYYWVKAILLYNHKFKNYLYMLFFLSYMLLIYKKRGMVLFLALTIILYFIKELSFKNKIIISLFAFTIFFILYVIFKENLEDSFSLYYSFIDVMDNKSDYNDQYSVGVRLFVELPTAIHWLSDSWKNFVLGSGNISHFFKGGFEGFFGYFYPGDLGIIGMIFKYGLLTQIFVKSIYIGIFKRYQKLNKTELSVDFKIILNVYFYFSVFIFLYSIQTGYDMKYFEMTLFLIYSFVSFDNNLNRKVKAD